jgi:hypothetical protein
MAALRKFGPLPPAGGDSQIVEIASTFTSFRSNAIARRTLASGEILDPIPM